MKRGRIVRRDKVRNREGEQHLKRGEQYLPQDHKIVIINISPTSSNSSKKWYQRFWKWLGWNKKPGIDIIGGFLFLLFVSLGIPITTSYITGQRYYDNFVSQYISSMENLLIEDKLHTNYIEKEYLNNAVNLLKNHPPTTQIEQIEKFIALLGNEQRIQYFNQLSQDPQNLERLNQALIAELKIEQKKKEAEYDQVRKIALSLTQDTLRNLGTDDGLWWNFLGTKHNPYRRNVLLMYLRQANLGFLPREDLNNLPKQKIDPEEQEIDPIKASYNFLMNLNLAVPKGGEKGLDLEEIIFDKAILEKADFTRANLKEGSFVDANLKKARFEGSILKAASFLNADLTEANLSKANLTKADLTKADLRTANLKGARYNQKTIVDSACYDDKTVFPDEEFKQQKSHRMRKVPAEQTCY